MAENKKKFDVKTYMNEKVPVTLIKDNDKYMDDIVVTHNGSSMKIPRGKTVMIPRKFALVIDNSLKQNNAANEFIRSQKETK